MKRPLCSLCSRVGETCVYPARRARGRKRRTSNTVASQQGTSSADGIANASISETSLQSTKPLSSTDPLLEYALSSTELSNDLSLPPPEFSGASLFSPDTLFGWPADFRHVSGFSVSDYHTHVELNEPALMSPALETQSDPKNPFTLASDDDLLNLHTGHPEAPLITSPLGITEVNHLGTQRYTVKVSTFVAWDLINEFFEHVHGWVPLFNSRNFKQGYGYLQFMDMDRVDNLSLESALILNGMFALSTRFSMLEAFKSEKRVHRGKRFFQEATRLYEISNRQYLAASPSLELLDGIILLTYNALQLGPTRQAWLMCGVCARLAYELGLHNTDVDIITEDLRDQNLTDETLRDREERRRAWWVVWDMDTFANSMALTPFVLSFRHANVLLPMSDDEWLGSQSCTPTYLEADTSTPWKKLSNLPKQGAWAWFLVGTTILRQAVDAGISRTNFQDLERVEICADCFAMVLPEIFQLDVASVSFTEQNFGEMNWVMSTLTMLQW